MLRNLVRNFQKVVVINKTKLNRNSLLLFRVQQQRSISEEQPYTVNVAKMKGTTTMLGTSNAGNSDYIVPIEFSKENKLAAHAVITTLRTRFRLHDVEIEKIMSDETMSKTHRGKSLVKTLEMLCLEGIAKGTFIDYPWILTLDRVRLEKKLYLIKSMPIRDLNHFIAFLRLSLPRLKKLVSSLNREKETIPFGNRVYFISDQLQIPPYIVTKYLSKRLFILEMPFEMLDQNLNYMIEYNVSPINILRDLWAFRYTPKSVKLRLERAKTAKKDKIMPWMVRCPESILQKSLKLSLDELKVLGDKSSAEEYLAERLGFTVAEVNAIMDRHPQVHTVRVTKIKEVLDYLLDEAGYSRYDIAQTPRILCHSLETTKQRLDELKQLGCRPTSLIIVCRSKREYEKFLNLWRQVKLKTTTTQKAVANSINLN